MIHLIPGYYPNPKPMFFSKFMTMCGLTGIFSPFTIEANYNKDMPLYNIPFTMSHELSHLKGYMQEDEANFIAYMACVKANDPYVNYSGYLNAFVYVTNALYASGENVEAYYQRLPEKAMNDLQENQAFWNQYSETLSNITSSINDTYLKINDVSEGVKSYSLFVTLLYSYYQTYHEITFQHLTSIE